MTTLAPVIAFLAGFLLAELREGWVRLAGLWAMIGATGAGLALTTSRPEEAAWAVGPMLASALLVSTPSPPLAFERLMLRTAVTIVLVFLGGYVARRLPFGDTPWAIEAMAWVLAAAGLAWLWLPRDRLEARRGAVLAIAGGSAALLALFPTGATGAAIAGLLAAAPMLGERRPVAGASRAQSPPASAFLLAMALPLAGLALSGGAGVRTAPLGLALSLSPNALAGCSLLLVVAAFSMERAVAAAAVLAGGSLLLASPAPHWAGIAAAVAVLSSEAGAARLLWTGVFLLGLGPALSALIGGPLGARWEAALLAPGWLLLLLPRQGRWGGPLLLAASTFVVWGDLHLLGAPGLARFQWLAAAGAVLTLVIGTLPPDRARIPAPAWGLRAVMSTGLILVGVSTAAPLGMLGAVLLVIDLALVQASAPMGPPAGGPVAWAALLARSGWPPSAAFAGRVLVLLAAAGTSLVLTLSAILLYAGLQLAPALQPHQPARPGRAGLRDWLATGVSLTTGIAPAILLRMLQGG